jgi:hypothetical protein
MIIREKKGDRDIETRSGGGTYKQTALPFNSTGLDGLTNGERLHVETSALNILLSIHSALSRVLCKREEGKRRCNDLLRLRPNAAEFNPLRHVRTPMYP